MSTGMGIGGAADSLLTGLKDRKIAKENTKFAYRQLAEQREFAQMGIRWKVEDAKAAGIHPLAALGAQTHNFSPVAINNQSNWESRVGQNIGRAVDTMKTTFEKKMAALQLEKEQSMIDNMKLRNNVIATQLRDLETPPMDDIGTDPASKAWGILGQPNGTSQITKTPGVDFVNAQVTKSQKPGYAAGMQPMKQLSITENKSIYPLLGREVTESMENDWATQTKYFIGQVADHVKWYAIAGFGTSKAKGNLAKDLRKIRSKAPKGWEFRWNFNRMLFVARKKRGKSQFYDHVQWGMIPY